MRPDFHFHREAAFLILATLGYVSESGEDTVKTHVSRLRNRLKDVDDFQIITIKGLGYKAELVKEKEQ